MTVGRSSGQSLAGALGKAALSFVIACGGAATESGATTAVGAVEPAQNRPDPRRVGCADGEREGFRDHARHPDIAACAGGWSIAGIGAAVGRSLSPACGRAAGDDGANAAGAGCSVADLCAEGWHVCTSAAEVLGRTSGSGCAGIEPESPEAFFATRQTGPGSALCGTSGENDLFGCGNLGATPDATSCAPLDRFSHDRCGALGPPWSCPDDPELPGAGEHEARTVVKRDGARGGVLCCRG